MTQRASILKSFSRSVPTSASPAPCAGRGRAPHPTGVDEIKLLLRYMKQPTMKQPTARAAVPIALLCRSPIAHCEAPCPVSFWGAPTRCLCSGMCAQARAQHPDWQYRHGVRVCQALQGAHGTEVGVQPAQHRPAGGSRAGLTLTARPQVPALHIVWAFMV